MNGRLRVFPAAAWLASLVICASPALGLVVGSTDEFSGAWTGTDWSLPTTYVYPWLNGAAVAVSPYYLLTARHVGGSPGQQMTSPDGTVYTCVLSKGLRKDPGSPVYPDLWLIKLDYPLPGYYPMYRGDLSNDTSAILIGYGYTGTASATEYTWDTSTGHIKRWGTNIVDDTYRFNYYSSSHQLVYSSQALHMDFDLGGTEFEAGLAPGDSGGGLFVKVEDQWELGGINAYATTYLAHTAVGSLAVSVPYYFDSLYRAIYLEGDTNRDDVVDVVDLNNVLDNLGSTGTGLVGDANRDGVVDMLDLNFVFSDLGNALPPLQNSGGAIPEPATLSLLAAGSAWLLNRRRTR